MFEGKEEAEKKYSRCAKKCPEKADAETDHGET
jgi:hypothetical protein